MRFPILIRLNTPTRAYQWRLVDTVYQSGQTLLESALATSAILALALARTGWWPFAAMILVAILVTAARLRARHVFLRERATHGDAMPGSPKLWAIRHLVGAYAAAALWGVIDLCVLLRFHDPMLQTFTLMIQAGWLAGTCSRLAARRAGCQRSRADHDRC